MTRKNGNGRRVQPRCASCRKLLRDTQYVYCDKCATTVKRTLRPA
jgi:hypothetical protein